MENSEADKRRMKHVIIIGAMKAGTTFLYNALVQHPAICPCAEKEPEYFSRIFGPRDYTDIKYRDLFPFRGEHQYTLEASVGYSKYPMEKDVPGRIKMEVQNPRFIYVIRNPIDRIESHFNYMSQRPDWNYDITDDHLINTSRYMLQLEQYLKHFEKEAIKIVLFEEMIADPHSVFQQIFSFLGIPDFEVYLAAADKNATLPISKTYLSIIRNLNFIKFLFPPDKRESAKKTLKRFLPGEKARLSVEDRQRIQRSIAPDMLALEKAFGIDVSMWGF